MKEEQIFSTNGARAIGHQWQINEPQMKPPNYLKMYHAKQEMQIYQTFRKNIGEKFWNLGLGKEFIDVTPKEQFIKGKIEK